MVNWLNHIDGQWLILAVKPEKRAETYVAFFPVLLKAELAQGRGFYNHLQMAGEPVAGYTGFICDQEFDERAIPALAKAAKSLNWTFMNFAAVSASENRLRLFLDDFPGSEFTIETIERRTKGQDTDYSIYPLLKLPQDWETFLATKLGRNTRKSARRCMRLIETDGCHVTVADAQSFERDLDALSTFWKAAWQPIKGVDEAQRELEHHRIMLRACFAAGDVFMPVLWQGDTPLGVRARLIDKKNRSLICLIGARDLSVQRPPPGFILHLYSIRWAIENGFEVYDFQTGNHPYKYDFGPDDRRIDSRLVVTANRQNLRSNLEPRSLPAVFSQTKALPQGRSDSRSRHRVPADPSG